MRQQEIMVLQDDMLLDISKGVDRLYIQVGTVLWGHVANLTAIYLHAIYIYI